MHPLSLCPDPSSLLRVTKTPHLVSVTLGASLVSGSLVEPRRASIMVLARRTRYVPSA